MTSPNPQEGGKEQGFLPESPSADAGPSPRSPDSQRLGEVFAATVYRLCHTLTPADFTVEDREQLADHMINAAVEMVRSIRRNRAIGQEGSEAGDRASSRDEGGLRDEPENSLLQATGGDNGR